MSHRQTSTGTGDLLLGRTGKCRAVIELFRLKAALATITVCLPMLCLPAIAKATSSACFVTDAAGQQDHHPERLQRASANASTAGRAFGKDESYQSPSDEPTDRVFENAVVTAVTVWCPLNIHPAIALESVSVEVVRLARMVKETDSSTDAKESVGEFNCALMSRSATGGQVSGRRVSRVRSGRMLLPAEESEASADSVEDIDEGNRYRFVACDLPAYSAIVSYTAQTINADTQATDLQSLIDELQRKPLPGSVDAVTQFNRPGDINTPDRILKVEDGSILPRHAPE